jgi:hypothetical protein
MTPVDLSLPVGVHAGVASVGLAPLGGGGDATLLAAQAAEQAAGASGSAIAGATLVLPSSNLGRMLADSLNLYQSALASFTLWWQLADALFVQRFDALLSMGNGALSKSRLPVSAQARIASSLQTLDRLFTNWEDSL